MSFAIVIMVRGVNLDKFSKSSTFSTPLADQARPSVELAIIFGLQILSDSGVVLQTIKALRMDPFSTSTQV